MNGSTEVVSDGYYYGKNCSTGGEFASAASHHCENLSFRRVGVVVDGHVDYQVGIL